MVTDKEHERLCDRFDVIKSEFITAVVVNDWAAGVQLAIEALVVLELLDAIAQSTPSFTKWNCSDCVAYCTTTLTPKCFSTE